MKKFLILVLVVFVFSGCSGLENESKKIDVVSSFYPIEFIISKIEPELAQKNLVGSKNIHGFDLSTKDAAILSQAKVVIGLDLELEPWLDSFSDKNLYLVDAGLDLLEIGDEHGHDDEMDEHGHGHDDEIGDEHGHDDEIGDEHGHDDLTYDPHVWLSPKNMIKMAENVYAILNKNGLLSSGSQDRLEGLISELEELDREFVVGVRSCKADTAFISHNSFAYLESLYGFDLTNIVGVSSLDRLSLKRLKDLHDTNTNSVLVEALENMEYADLLKKDLNLKAYVVYNISKQIDGMDYIEMQYKNLESLKKALECL